MKIYKAKPRRCHKIHSGSIADVSVIKILLVLPKVISLAARSHLARDGIRGLLWALNMIFPTIRSATFGCLFRSCLSWITCCVFICKCQCIHILILARCLHESSQEIFGCETTIFSFSSKPCFIKMTKSNVAKFYCPPVPPLVPSSFTSQRLLFMAKGQPINLAMFQLLSPFSAPARIDTTLPGSSLGTSGLTTLLLYTSTSQERELSRNILLR